MQQGQTPVSAARNIDIAYQYENGRYKYLPLIIYLLYITSQRLSCRR